MVHELVDNDNNQSWAVWPEFLDSKALDFFPFMAAVWLSYERHTYSLYAKYRKKELVYVGLNKSMDT